MKILVVEDEQRLAEALHQVLTEDAYAVDLAPDGASASELAAINDYDLIILDLTIPPPTGLELLTTGRAQGSGIPVLILPALASVQDRVVGLDAGADDYLAKPFSFAELLARVRSLLRRRARPVASSYQAGDLVMDRVSREIKVGGRLIPVSPKEFALLEFLLLHKDELVTRSQIREHVWASDFDSATNIINVFIYRLRKKIDGTREDKLLRTVPGQGYILGSERRIG
jgi:DNA-binding response OmpR family regulator